MKSKSHKNLYKEYFCAQKKLAIRYVYYLHLLAAEKFK